MTQLEKVQVLYGSQTGNAESIAKHTHEEALSRGFESHVAVLDDFEKVEWNAASVLVIIISTTGDGDFPDNTTKFFRWTRRGKKDELEAAFKGKQFTVLALGDTNYSNFCQTGKRIERRLIELGATTFLPKGLADDATGLEAVIDPWMAKLWGILPSLVRCDQDKANAFANKAALPASSILAKKPKLDTETATASTVAETVSEPMDVDTPAYYVPFKFPLDTTTVPSKSEDVVGATMIPTEYLTVSYSSTTPPRETSTSQKSLFHLFHQPSDPIMDPFEYSAVHPFGAKVVGHRYLTGAKALKKVLEVTFDIAGMRWKQPPAGGVIGIVAPNPDECVLPLLKRLGVDAARVLDVGLANGETGIGGLPFVTDVAYTAYEAFRYFLDINPPLRKPLLRVMAEYATEESERAVLLHLTSTAGAALFKTLKQSTPSLASLLATFPSVDKLPLNRLLENLTRLQPRFYSISRISGTTISVAFNIVEYENPVTKQPVVGLCSTYLERLVLTGAKDTLVPVFPKPNVVFAPPADPAVDIVLVAAGTGITPFLSFLQVRAEAQQAGKKVGTTLLLHGRRFADLSDGDRIYGTELDAYLQQGVLTRFVEVLSREEGGVKYVQEAVEEKGEDVWRVLDAGGRLYVCGGVEMARDVHAAVGRICAGPGRFEGGEKEIKAYLKKLTSDERYLKEIWS
ncbi:hypothetical protein HDU98_011712 [Podochytrium sp. JEL0797]|nr:hypothetical protein HDU98_011712 [Podochytrium sp. JEL0797]